MDRVQAVWRWCATHLWTLIVPFDIFFIAFFALLCVITYVTSCEPYATASRLQVDVRKVLKRAHRHRLRSLIFFTLTLFHIVLLAILWPVSLTATLLKASAYLHSLTLRLTGIQLPSAAATFASATTAFAPVTATLREHIPTRALAALHEYFPARSLAFLLHNLDFGHFLTRVLGPVMASAGLLLLVRGLLAAGAETLRPSHSTHMLCSRVYARLRHPQFAGLISLQTRQEVSRRERWEAVSGDKVKSAATFWCCL